MGGFKTRMFISVVPPSVENVYIYIYIILKKYICVFLLDGLVRFL